MVCSRRRDGMREQIRNGKLQRLRQIRDGPQCHIARTPLNVRDVGPVQVGAPRQFLLCNSQEVAAPADDRAEPMLEV